MLGMIALVDGRNIVIESVAGLRVRGGSNLEIRRPSGSGASTLVARATVSSVSGRRVVARVSEQTAGAPDGAPAVSDQVYVVTGQISPR